VSGDVTSIRGVMLSDDGTRSVRAVMDGNDPFVLGRALAIELRDVKGGGELAGWQPTS
jgi:hypothetical protein